jgi:hypothetical protein
MKTAEEFVEKYAWTIRWGDAAPMEGDELKKFISDFDELLNNQYDEGYFDGGRDKAKEIEQAAHDLIPKQKAVRFKPPTAEEVEAYAKTLGLKIDGKFFISYYADNNWCNSQGKKVRNWKTTLKNNWNRAENRIAPTEDYLKPRTH